MSRIMPTLFRISIFSTSPLPVFCTLVLQVFDLFLVFQSMFNAQQSFHVANWRQSGMMRSAWVLLHSRPVQPAVDVAYEFVICKCAQSRPICPCVCVKSLCVRRIYLHLCVAGGHLLRVKSFLTKMTNSASSYYATNRFDRLWAQLAPLIRFRLAGIR